MPKDPNTQPKEEKPDYLEVAAAYLTHQRYTQTEVAEFLTKRGFKVSQSGVSRLIEKAKETHGILIDRPPEFIRSKVPKDLLQRLESEYETDADLDKGLSRCSDVFHSVHVVQEADFIRGAAALLPYLLKDAAVLGISWGSTCRNLVDSLSTANEFQKLKACIPIQGDPAFWNNGKAAALSATRLAQLLEEALMKSRRNEQYQYSLVGVPAYVSPEKKEGAERFYGAMPGYRAVFGPGGAAEQLNGVITSVGVPSLAEAGKRSIFIRERIEQGDTTVEEVNKLCFGDFSGILLPRQDHFAKVGELNSGWTGLKDWQMKSIAKQDPAFHPGTILVAEGAYKAQVVLAAVRADFVTRLIVGTELAASLKRLLGHRSGT